MNIFSQLSRAGLCLALTILAVVLSACTKTALAPAGIGGEAFIGEQQSWRRLPVFGIGC